MASHSSARPAYPTDGLDSASKRWTLEHNRRGRCPKHALLWTREEHLPWWPETVRDRLFDRPLAPDVPSWTVGVPSGAVAPTSPEETQLREIMEQLQCAQPCSWLDGRPWVFCDLDGVLADFEAGVSALGFDAKQSMSCAHADRYMWAAINKCPHFYEHLPPTSDMAELWSALQPYSPVVLTGAPAAGFERHAADKRAWCKRHLGEHVPVIVCRSKDKPKYCLGQACVLIDDFEKNTVAWRDAGGTAKQWIPEHKLDVLAWLHAGAFLG